MLFSTSTSVLFLAISSAGRARGNFNFRGSGFTPERALSLRLCRQRVAQLLRERDTLTPNLELRLAVNLSCDTGRWRNFEFHVNIFLSRSRWATLYDVSPSVAKHWKNIILKLCIHQVLTRKFSYILSVRVQGESSEFNCGETYSFFLLEPKRVTSAQFYCPPYLPSRLSNLTQLFTRTRRVEQIGWINWQRRAKCAYFSKTDEHLSLRNSVTVILHVVEAGHSENLYSFVFERVDKESCFDGVAFERAGSLTSWKFACSYVSSTSSLLTFLPAAKHSRSISGAFH